MWPNKKRKVQISPNSKFATIRAIKEVQIAAGQRQIIPDKSESGEESDSTTSCIEVDARQSYSTSNCEGTTRDIYIQADPLKSRLHLYLTERSL